MRDDSSLSSGLSGRRSRGIEDAIGRADERAAAFARPDAREAAGSAERARDARSDREGADGSARPERRAVERVGA